MSRIIEQSKVVRIEEYRLSFENVDCPGSGYSFECDKNGNLLMDQISAHAYDNLLHCFTSDTVRLEGVDDYSRSYTEGPTVKCDCGSVVHCDDHWANSCDGCTREYNRSGQMLAPRSQWGSEFHTQPEEDYNLYSPENCR